jgi:hypothetical protein
LKEYKRQGRSAYFAKRRGAPGQREGGKVENRGIKALEFCASPLRPQRFLDRRSSAAGKYSGNAAAHALNIAVSVTT